MPRGVCRYTNTQWQVTIESWCQEYQAVKLASHKCYRNDSSEYFHFLDNHCSPKMYTFNISVANMKFGGQWLQRKSNFYWNMWCLQYLSYGQPRRSFKGVFILKIEHFVKRSFLSVYLWPEGKLHSKLHQNTLGGFWYFVISQSLECRFDI